ncbi:lytic murein transglycosylase [Phaeobacter porticola]|uniref:Putative lytic murein transglycosylase n=1 Tax=Phaeobacter porticola TaxID=1844006 RepID=A0A1L3I9X3_9RHOB|nr:lytic murein transglycosylase [Phaeobacter porticola]APG48904.1 putative lytic murein transglycosylase [Phaeobacter porticola]
MRNDRSAQRQMILQAATIVVLMISGGHAGASPLPAAGLQASLRPLARPEVAHTVATTQLRPRVRPANRHRVASAGPVPPKISPAEQRGFHAWIAAFRLRAQAEGLSRATLDQALADLEFDPDIVQRDGNQSEFVTPIWTYLERAVSDTRIENGQAALRDHEDVLNRVEARYGVDKEVVAAVWGMESNYGRFRGERDIVRSLATLAFDGRRGVFFESQLIAALQIIQAGDVDPRAMTGSWAGAMGHTQFMPTSYLAYAVDFTGDGKRDIWSDDPTDALASTAAYLKRYGWVKGQPWGIEVKLPPEFDYAQADRKITKSAQAWRQIGITRVDGGSLPDHGKAAVLLPAGAGGAAFMVYRNFAVIERYNAADAYVIGVGHLSDRLKGAGPFRTDWPRDTRPLTYKERRELQERLSGAGHETGVADGRIGPRTRAALRAYQIAAGLTPDGYASLSVLKRLRSSPGETPELGAPQRFN